MPDQNFHDSSILRYKLVQLDTSMHPTEYCSNVTQGGTLRPGVVYVGHIPHGFYEEEMRKYFSQFGTVTRLRLARSRKVGTLDLP